ncbi:T9SS sorting signal type C domain-containing protein [Flavobacterium sp. Sd200]|uniref:T9SS sorting signal type C domain-containing protein n=1 Tax=Flavobacterium sp. Sd200 TaxID=2692211 RepID=UPI001372278C|nr:T9SS sorting signal type C domain-containing protein [Flavobacterium sp. Sd200]MXN90793.1 T9SS sorting signal type C domain-containing protein [Flavobacterium sp. Sd200]
MKKHYFLLLVLLFGSQFVKSQTITETFDNEPNNSTTFSEGGITFNVTSQQSYFYVQGSFPHTGWTGTSRDNKYLDNSNYTSSSRGVTFTISAANGAAINLKSLWIYVSTSGLNLSPVGTLTITGKLGMQTVFTASRSNPFNPSASFNNGFTFFDMSNLGGQDNSNKVIDSYVISTDMGIGYLSVDAVTYTCAPVAFTATSQTNVTCNGANNGSATVRPTANGTLSYNWAPGNPAGDGTPTATGLTPGTWTCTVTNACGNSNTATFIITQPDVLTATDSQTNINCNGNSTGSIVVSASGGTPPYSYLWSTGETGTTLSNKPAGNYTINITDSKGCVLTRSFNLTQPDALTATNNQTHVDCNGNSTGSIVVSTSGGTPPYSYSWSTGETGTTITNKAAGNYTINITDSKGCILTETFTITQPEPLTATTTQTNINCYGSNTGSATVTPTGGTPPYTYSWLSTGSSTATANNLLAGDHTVTVTDAKNCTVTKIVTITQPLAPLTATTSQTNVNCYDGNTGSATVTPTGGTAPYTYQWSSGHNTATATHLRFGNYSVTIRDANNCSIVKTFRITQSSLIVAAIGQNNVSCYGGDDANAILWPSGGTPPYTYNWLPYGGNSDRAYNLAAGTYNVIITDANNCTGNITVRITQPELLTATTTQTNITTCHGDSTGSATVTPIGGTPPYTYSWLPYGGNDPTANNLTGGHYSVTVTDLKNCSHVVYLYIEQPPAIEVSVNHSNILCHGETGSISLEPVDSNDTYTYLWSTGQTTSSISGLYPGTYSVTISNTDGCNITEHYTITEPEPLTATQDQYNINCYNGMGVLSVNPSGGSGGYRYEWLPYGGNAYLAYGLTAGDYSVIITDGNGCSITKYFTLTNPEPLTATTSQTDPSCSNGFSGSATVEASGGTGPYTYSWYPYGGNEATVTGIYAGEFTVTITDRNLCSITKDFIINEPVITQVQITQTAATCQQPASVTANVINGTGEYTYLWQPSGITEATATNLSPGYHRVTVTDVTTSCTTIREVLVRGPQECITTTSWNGTEWSNGIPDCVSYAVEINGNYNTSLHGTITACSLTVNSGNVIVTPGYTFSIKGSVTVAEEASLVFQDNAALLQADNFNDNSGNITIQKNSNPLYRLDYTLWSSPVAGQNLLEFSPLTATGRFYQYGYGFDPTLNNGEGAYIEQYWYADTATDFATAKSYLIRMPNSNNTPGYNEGTAPITFTGNFTGVANNGYITTPASTQGDRYTAIGNPYPSPLNLNDFFDYNSYVIDTQSGLYFWRKRNNTIQSSYATLTLAAFTANGSLYGGSEQAGFYTGDSENWLISQGQGFIVKTNDLAEYTQITFTNSMRRPAPQNGLQPFLRTSAQSQPSRFWLNLTNSSGAFSQTAVAYLNSATAGIDYGYDGQIFGNSETTLYSIASEVNLAVQARPSFTINDVVSMGYIANATGQYTISLDHFEGLFNQDQSIYLKDNFINQVYDLKEDDYTFTSESGTFNSRFEIQYTNQTLKIQETELNSESVIVYRTENSIHIDTGLVSMNDVVIYDTRGRMLYHRNNINTVKTDIEDLQAENQVLIVEINTEKGTVNKRIVF